MEALDLSNQLKQVNTAFSKQSNHFDEDDFSNLILQHLRMKVYSHLDRYLKPDSLILEWESFHTWYHSLKSVRNAFGKNFKIVSHSGLAAISPPPYASRFALNHPILFKILQRADNGVRNYFPFNRWADHIIVSLQFVP